jgi:hypothetical protein
VPETFEWELLRRLAATGTRLIMAQETRVPALAVVIRGIELLPEHPIPNASHLESRTRSASEIDNIRAQARAIPTFWENVSTARMTRISTAINSGYLARREAFCGCKIRI